MCKLFVNVAIDGFDSSSGHVEASALTESGNECNNNDWTLLTLNHCFSEKILVMAKEKSHSSYETTNALLTHMGLLKVRNDRLLIIRVISEMKM